MKKELEKFTAILKNKLGPSAVQVGQQDFINDPRGRLVNQSTICLKPKNTAEVSTILGLANKNHIPIVLVGGSTGLVGGQIASCEFHVSLSLEKMNGITFSDSDLLISVQAGAILADIKRVAEDNNRLFPLSIASEGSCQIGGNLATNAGGLNVLNYGNIRDLCIGIEAVLPNGEIMSSMKAVKKNNMGFDLRGLFIGSEGTLAVITKALLKTFPLPRNLITTFVAVDEVENAIEIFKKLNETFHSKIIAFELIKSTSLDFLVKTGCVFKPPFNKSHPWILLIEFDVDIGSISLKEGVFEALHFFLENNKAVDILIAESRAQRLEFWQIRELIPEANRRIKAICSNDIAVPIGLIPSFIKKADQCLLAFSPDLEVNCFGHVGDGNLHYNIFPRTNDVRQRLESKRKIIIEIINNIVDELSGSLSAEHGIGRIKSQELFQYEMKAS